MSKVCKTSTSCIAVGFQRWSFDYHSPRFCWPSRRPYTPLKTAVNMNAASSTMPRLAARLTHGLHISHAAESFDINDGDQYFLGSFGGAGSAMLFPRDEVHVEVAWSIMRCRTSQAGSWSKGLQIILQERKARPILQVVQNSLDLNLTCS